MLRGADGKSSGYEMEEQYAASYSNPRSSSYSNDISNSAHKRYITFIVSKPQCYDFAIFQTVLVNITAIDLQTAVEIKFLKINSNVYRK